MLFEPINVFVDGGGNDCNTINKYLKKFHNFDKIYVFEPNPFFHDSYRNSNFILVKKAIWTSNCQLPFYVSKDDRQIASSLLEDKLCKVNSEIKYFFHDETIQVECVDFGEWIKEHIQPHHNLTLKLDIEGAEYDVLWKMIHDGTIKYIQNLFVEFHLETVISKQSIHSKLIKALTDCGLPPQEWD